MKKTKILVPALGILALGMAASVTGTVAWFSTNTMVYADGVQVSTQAQDSLVIGLTQNGTFGSKVTHQWATLTTVNPAFCLASAGELAEAPQFKALDASKLVGANATYEVRENGKVYAIANPAKPENEYEDPATSAAFIAANTNPDVRAIEYIDASEWLKMNGTENKQVTAKIYATRTSGKAIDQALRIGFWDGANFTINTPFSSTESSNTPSFVTAAFQVTPTAKNVHIYVWYDGQDAACINANATTNAITINADYTYSARS